MNMQLKLSALAAHIAATPDCHQTFFVELDKELRKIGLYISADQLGVGGTFLSIAQVES